MKIDFTLLLEHKMARALTYAFWAIITTLHILAAQKYVGQWHVYLLFSITSNLLLYFGFRRNAIFFDTFIGVFFWLGFWLKSTLRIIFSNGIFNVPVGSFDGSAYAFDQAFLVSSTAFLGLLIASLLREHVFFQYPFKAPAYIGREKLLNWYERYRKPICFIFVLLVLFIGISNVYWGIYQRGSITRTFLPLGMNGIYKWLLLFGLASFSATLLWLETQQKKQIPLMIIPLALLESCVSNVSLLSRGMILNGSAVLYGLLQMLKANAISVKVHHIVITIFLFSTLFISSVYLVNYLRADLFNDLNYSEQEIVDEMHASTSPLFVDRWVGIEGVMAVASYPALGWDLWRKALAEVYDENQTSFYDNNFIESSYVNTDKSKHHFISLPGIVAFLFYPGSFTFVFSAMLLAGLGAAAIEYATYRLCGKNLILCALFAQVIAFRFASFGYVPKQSYLLFGTLILNIFIIYLVIKLAQRRVGADAS